jgi:type III secretion protein T
VDSPTSDYLSFLFNIPHLSPTSILCLFMLGLMRVAPMVTIAPFLGSKLPGAVKMGIAISLVVIMLPQIAMTTTTPIDFNMYFVGYAVKELLVGLLLAIIASFPFYVAESAGVLIDFQRGSSALMVNDPTMDVQVSPIGLLYNYILIVLFFQISGPFLFLDGVLQTYTIIPADKMISPTFFNLDLPLWQMLLNFLTKFTAISIQLASPSLVAILMAEMFLGIANRLAPQVQIAFLGMSIKSLLGIALLFAGWIFILNEMGKQSLIWIKEITKLLHSLSA